MPHGVYCLSHSHSHFLCSLSLSTLTLEAKDREKAIRQSAGTSATSGAARTAPMATRGARGGAPSLTNCSPCHAPHKLASQWRYKRSMLGPRTRGIAASLWRKEFDAPTSLTVLVGPVSVCSRLLVIMDLSQTCLLHDTCYSGRWKCIPLKVLTANLPAGPPMTPPDGPLKKRLKKMRKVEACRLAGANAKKAASITWSMPSNNMMIKWSPLNDPRGFVLMDHELPGIASLTHLFTHSPATVLSTSSLIGHCLIPSVSNLYYLDPQSPFQSDTIIRWPTLAAARPLADLVAFHLHNLTINPGKHTWTLTLKTGDSLFFISIPHPRQSESRPDLHDPFLVMLSSIINSTVMITPRNYWHCEYPSHPLAHPIRLTEASSALTVIDLDTRERTRALPQECQHSAQSPHHPVATYRSAVPDPPAAVVVVAAAVEVRSVVDARLVVAETVAAADELTGV
ncbi:uncharacterized protein CLUP02_06877 [Colletotrichum lupini]|uniref:Uncharacterized protein n=1 Tax=Colletotrichum lupini TaxID=145971 RepID=A0A9Q8SQ32_9PEZI|nr:uncharacterized protein CLUP02_06877 [Colletotrichum lupini]UQC81391.1 hypothetical protein CLUP02_06877 [Colletotrichum lupini]